jgi:hypothetical protein
MTSLHRVSTIGAVIVCLLAVQASVVFASDSEQPAPAISVDGLATTMTRPSLGLDAAVLAATPSPAQEAWRNFSLAPSAASAAGGQVYRGRPYRMSRDGSIAAIVLGAAATIAGSAVLIYANRPECNTNQSAGGCGYGTKVIGGSVLAGGVVSLFVGALTWR